jgi:hypothetical protein
VLEQKKKHYPKSVKQYINNKSFLLSSVFTETRMFSTLNSTRRGKINAIDHQKKELREGEREKEEEEEEEEKEKKEKKGEGRKFLDWEDKVGRGQRQKKVEEKEEKR